MHTQTDEHAGSNSQGPPIKAQWTSTRSTRRLAACVVGAAGAVFFGLGAVCLFAASTSWRFEVLLVGIPFALLGVMGLYAGYCEYARPTLVVIANDTLRVHVYGSISSYPLPSIIAVDVDKDDDKVVVRMKDAKQRTTTTRIRLCDLGNTPDAEDFVRALRSRCNLRDHS